jgi:putative transposase
MNKKKLIYSYYLPFNVELSKICQTSKELYNQANYIVRQEYILNKKWLRYNQLNKIMQETENLEKEINYYKLKSQNSQQILMLLDKNWKSYFNSKKDYSKNKEKYSGKPNFPGYIKEKEFLSIQTNQSSIIKTDGFIYFSRKLKIPIPQFEKYKNNILNFQQIRVIPENNKYKIEIIYNFEPIQIELDENKIIGIDLGISNFATVTNNFNNNPVIYSGKILKSKNRNYNKKLAKLKSIRTNGHNVKTEKGYFKNTKLMKSITEKRNNQIKDILHKISKKIIDYCILNHVSKIVIGSSSNWKTQSDIGKKNNQNFQLLPFKIFIKMLKYKGEMYGIKLIETEESYTSKCSALDSEPLHKKEFYYGKRTRRGLYQTSENLLINADINGSLNIIRKVVGDDFINQLDSRVLFNPLMIRNIFDI